MAEITHADLVQRAARWLRNSAVVDGGYDNPKTGRPWRCAARCAIVFTDHASSSREFPDAIGWFAGGSGSIVIEAKATKSDFRADGRKSFRRAQHRGTGAYRYYLTPPGLVSIDDVPELWGLLECGPHLIKVRRLAKRQPYNVQAELRMVCAAYRRAAWREQQSPAAGEPDNSEGTPPTPGE